MIIDMRSGAYPGSFIYAAALMLLFLQSCAATLTTPSSTASRSPSVTLVADAESSLLQAGYPSGSFPITAKGCGATVLRITGEDTEIALAIGTTTKLDAIECCQRDSGGITIPNGGLLTVQQCIDATLEAEGEAMHSSSADCPRKRVMTNWGGPFVMIRRSSDSNDPWKFTWKNESTGDILDGSNSSGALIVTQTFELLCPAFSR